MGAELLFIAGISAMGAATAYLNYFRKHVSQISDGVTPRIRTYLKKKAKRVKRNRIEYSFICPNPKCRKELRGTETACPECGKDLTEYDLRGELMNQFKDMLRRRRVYLSSYDDIDYCRKKGITYCILQEAEHH